MSVKAGDEVLTPALKGGTALLRFAASTLSVLFCVSFALCCSFSVLYCVVYVCCLVFCAVF